jgi:long-chain acyl-CoA synthetase
LFAPNHASFLDAFAVAGALPSALLEQTYWGGWTGYAFRNRVFSSISRLVHIVPVDAQRAASSSLAFAATVLGRGDHLVWFPEGARSPNGELLDFKPGIGMLVEQFPDVCVVPTYITGAYEAWPRDRALPRLKRIGVTFGASARGAALADAGRGDSYRERVVDGLEAAVRSLAE